MTLYILKVKDIEYNVDFIDGVYSSVEELQKRAIYSIDKGLRGVILTYQIFELDQPNKTEINYYIHSSSDIGKEVLDKMFDRGIMVV